MNIEDIQVGDLVYSYNTITSEIELKAVTKTIALTSEHVRYVTLENKTGVTQTLETTDAHPFWVVTDDIDLSRAARSMVDENGVWLYHDNISPTDNGYWVEAKDLRVGDVVLGANGELSLVQSTMRIDIAGGISVFNFEVEGNHNYFVLAKEFEYGQTCVLVHNACNDLTDFRKTHILNRHRYGSNKPGKTEFPKRWSDQRILNAISDVATHPKSKKGIGRYGEETFEGVRGGILTHVDMYPPNSIHFGKISTAYPII